MRNVITHELLEYSWVYSRRVLVYGPKWPFLFRYGSCDTRRIDFLWVDRLSTDTPGLGHHTSIPVRGIPYVNGGVKISFVHVRLAWSANLGHASWHLKETVTRTGVYRVNALTKLW